MKRKYHTVEQIVNKLRQVDAVRHPRYNHYRPHNSLDYMMPTAFKARFIPSALPMAQSRECTTENVDNSLIVCSI